MALFKELIGINWVNFWPLML